MQHSSSDLGVKLWVRTLHVGIQYSCTAGNSAEKLVKQGINGSSSLLSFKSFFSPVQKFKNEVAPHLLQHGIVALGEGGVGILFFLPVIFVILE